ncbi:MAG: hypothetical protein HYX41_05015 [Bdellovibrio sp.]|nr:hypothetical protein [Bdellovibrio sp.]
MDWVIFKTEVTGKWVLAGEHSVLRGATAVALPHKEAVLRLSFTPSDGSGLGVEPKDAQEFIGELVGSVAEAWENSGKTFQKPVGTLTIESTIPIGAGLGSSAALCVALTRWMAGPLRISEPEQIDFATHLEHRFHGRSSGMDVAVIANGEPISFVMGQGSKLMGIQKTPKFTFHDTGLRSRTSEAVVRVEKFREESPEIAVKVDDAMARASRKAMEGLVLYDAGSTQKGLLLVQEGMREARECFYAWQLVPGEARRIEEDLLKKGALAVKLTGAGGGGMIVALWPDS